MRPVRWGAERVSEKIGKRGAWMKVVANSIPKSGTHLLSRLLMLLGFERKRMGINQRLVAGPFSPIRRFLRAREPEKVPVGVVSPQQIGRRWLQHRLAKVPDGCFVTAHCIYTPELAGLFREGGMRVVCILRDPRDVAVSQMHYIKEQRQHFAHAAFVALPNDRERLLVSIRGGELGGRELRSLGERYRQFLGWEQDEGAVVVRFEDLVGSRGGGGIEAQRRTVERVAAHLGLPVNERKIRLVEEELFGVGTTFRKGQIGGWREEFFPEHVQAAKEVVGSLLVTLGYERDSDW
jgi:Sulfotransferase domain